VKRGLGQAKAKKVPRASRASKAKCILSKKHVLTQQRQVNVSFYQSFVRRGGFERKGGHSRVKVSGL